MRERLGRAVLTAAALGLVCVPGCGDDAAPDEVDAGDFPDADAGPMPDAATDLCEGVDCSSMTTACAVGTCDPETGACRAVPVADGTSCDDGDLCTENEQCVGGTCTPGSTLDCSHLDAMCAVGACGPEGCEVEPLTGTPCDLGDFCSWQDLCDAGTCTGTVTDCGAGGVIPGGETAATAIQGGPGGNAFRDECPAGQVVIGIEATVATGEYYFGNLLQFVTICGTVREAEGVVVTERAARVPSPGRRGIWWPTGAAQQVLCPSGSVVVGISSDILDSYISRIGLRCAPLSFDGSVEAGYTVVIGTAEDGPVRGSSLGTALPPTDCPAGTVARGTIGRAGEVLDAVGLVCQPLGARAVTTAPPAGGTDGTLTYDECPPARVPVGITASVAEGDAAGALTRFSMQCATLRAAEGESGGWTAELTAGNTVPDPGSGRGTAAEAGEPVAVSCPEGEVLVGVSGTADTNVKQLTLRCAAPSISGDETSGFTVGYGTVSDATTVGTATGTTAFGPYDCPAGTLPSGFRVQSDEVVDQLALRCIAPTIAVAPPPPAEG